MSHVSAQGVNERMINIHYYYYQYTTSVDIKKYALKKKDTVTHLESHASVRRESAREQRITLYRSYE